MSVTILSKPSRDVRDKRSGEFRWQLEDGIEKYFKLDMGIRE